MQSPALEDPNADLKSAYRTICLYNRPSGMLLYMLVCLADHTHNRKTKKHLTVVGKLVTKAKTCNL